MNQRPLRSLVCHLLQVFVLLHISRTDIAQNELDLMDSMYFIFSSDPRMQRRSSGKAPGLECKLRLTCLMQTK